MRKSCEYILIKDERKSLAKIFALMMAVTVVSSFFFSDFSGIEKEETNRIRKSFALRSPVESRAPETRKQTAKMETEMEKAESQIEAAEEAIVEAETLIESWQREIPNNTIVLLNQAREHLIDAREAYAEGNYGEAYGRAKAAEKLARNAVRNLSERCSPEVKSEVDMEEGTEGEIEEEVPAENETEENLGGDENVGNKTPEAEFGDMEREIHEENVQPDEKQTEDMIEKIHEKTVQPDEKQTEDMIENAEETDEVVEGLGGKPTDEEFISSSVDETTEETEAEVEETETTAESDVEMTFDNTHLDEIEWYTTDDDLETKPTETWGENVLFLPPTTAKKPPMLTIWYLLLPPDLPDPVCGDPWIYTYVVNTSGETLYNVNFEQFIPPDLRLVRSPYHEFSRVLRYGEKRIENSKTEGFSGSYTYPSVFTCDYSNFTFTQITTLTGDTKQVTWIYAYDDGRVENYSYSLPNPYTRSYHYTITWSENEETKVYNDGYFAYRKVNTNGRQGTLKVVRTYTTRSTQSGSNILLKYDGTEASTSDYIERFYTVDENSPDGTNLSTTYLGPMDAIVSLIRVVPSGKMDSNKDYCVTTVVSFDTEREESYAVADSATWREPFSIFASIGAPYLGTATLTHNQFRSYRQMFERPVVGGFQPPDEKMFEFENSPPREFDLLAPANGTTTTDNTPELSWSPSSDDGSGIWGYVIYVDDSFHKVVTGTRTSEIASELSPGTHTWYVVAVDCLGNERQSTSTWVVNIEGPTSAPSGDSAGDSDEEGKVMEDNTSGVGSAKIPRTMMKS
jgi:hypothetical protein